MLSQFLTDPYFNPPAPWGAGQRPKSSTLSGVIFQSTRPVGGGTLNIPGVTFVDNISIHPPRGGRDGWLETVAHCFTYFNPPAPWGAGPVCRAIICHVDGFQSTRPVGGGTAIMHKICFAHFCNLHNHATVRVLRQAMTAAAAPSGPDSASIFRCEPFGIFLTASASHRQIIRTPSA